MLPDDDRVVINCIVQALKGEVLTLYGDGSQTRSFCFVDDLIEGMIRLMLSSQTDAELTTIGVSASERRASTPSGSRCGSNLYHSST